MGKHERLITRKNIEELSGIVHVRVVPSIPRSDFKLRDQIERATSSIGANFIEGYYSGSTKEFIKFLGYSRRSAAEVEFWITYCRMKKYISDDLHAQIHDLDMRTGYLIDRLIFSLKNKIKNQ